MKMYNIASPMACSKHVKLVRSTAKKLKWAFKYQLYSLQLTGSLPKEQLITIGDQDGHAYLQTKASLYQNLSLVKISACQYLYVMISMFAPFIMIKQRL